MVNKEVVIEEMKKTLEGFYESYKLPECSITDGEWKAFYDVLYDHLGEEFETAINIVIRRALTKSIFDNATNFTLYYLILALDDLQAFHIKVDEIEAIKKEIMLYSLKSNNKVKKKKRT